MLTRPLTCVLISCYFSLTASSDVASNVHLALLPGGAAASGHAHGARHPGYGHRRPAPRRGPQAAPPRVRQGPYLSIHFSLLRILLLRILLLVLLILLLIVFEALLDLSGIKLDNYGV